MRPATTFQMKQKYANKQETRLVIGPITRYVVGRKGRENVCYTNSKTNLKTLHSNYAEIIPSKIYNLLYSVHSICVFEHL